MDEMVKIYLSIMLKELDDFKLEVILTPAPEPNFQSHKIRSVVNCNPEWYQDLCNRYPRTRRNRAEKFTDSKIVRKDVANCLQRLIDGKDSKSYFKDDLIELAEERINEDVDKY